MWEKILDLGMDTLTAGLAHIALELEEFKPNAERRLGENMPLRLLRLTVCSSVFMAQNASVVSVFHSRFSMLI